MSKSYTSTRISDWFMDSFPKGLCRDIPDPLPPRNVPIDSFIFKWRSSLDEWTSYTYRSAPKVVFNEILSDACDLFPLLLWA